MSDILPNVALLYGDDDFAIAEHLAALAARLGAPDNAGLNLDEFDARRTGIGDLRAVCDTMPFLTPQRMAVVTHLENSSGALIDRPVIKDLIAYVPAVPEFTSLVLVVNGKLRDNNKLLKTVGEHPEGEVRRFDIPTGSELIAWIQSRAAAQGGEFDRDGAHALALAAGDEPRLAAHEIDKLLAYVNWSRPVRGEDVEQLTPAASHANIFNLVDALGQRRGRTAMRELRRLLDQPGQEPFSIFAMIVRQFRLLLSAKEMVAQGCRAPEIASVLGVRPFVADKLISQSRRYSAEHLERVYARLLELDVEMKSGADHLATLDMLVVGLTI